MRIETLAPDQRRTFPVQSVRSSGPAASVPELDRFLSLPDVIRLTTLAKATIYRRISQGTFPKPITLSRTKVAWSAFDIAHWQQAQRDTSAPSDASTLEAEGMAA